MLWWRVLEDLLQQQWVLDQTGARDVQETPQVQLPAEGRLQAALQEVLHAPVLLLLVQQRLGSELVAAVLLVGIQARQLGEGGRGFSLIWFSTTTQSYRPTLIQSTRVSNVVCLMTLFDKIPIECLEMRL